MRAGGGELIELAPVGLDDGGAGLLRHGGEAGKGAVGLAGGDVELVDGAASGERFLHGVAALEHIFCRLRRAPARGAEAGGGRCGSIFSVP